MCLAIIKIFLKLTEIFKTVTFAERVLVLAQRLDNHLAQIVHPNLGDGDEG